MVGLTWQNGIILMYYKDYIVWLENSFIFINYWLVSRVQNWSPVRDSGARSIEGVFL